jgi:hypothetical protein
MVYGIIGRIVVWALRRVVGVGKRRLRRGRGNRRRPLGAGVVVAGALAALVLGGRGRGE